MTDVQRDKETDIATYRMNRPKGRFIEKKTEKALVLGAERYSVHLALGLLCTSPNGGQHWQPPRICQLETSLNVRKRLCTAVNINGLQSSAVLLTVL